ncbi:MAG: metallophosphoesterase [Erysipelotrichaceae bacterium]
MKKKLLIIFAAVCCVVAFTVVYDKSYQPAKILVTSDIHYLSEQLHDDGIAYQYMLDNSDGRLTQYCQQILDAFIEDVLYQKPDVLIISGDLTLNGEKLSHLALAEKLSVLTESGIQVLVTAGNHDINSYRAAGFFDNEYVAVDSIDETEFVTIYNDCGFAQAYSRDESSLSYMYQVNDDLFIIMLDTNGYGKNYLQQDTYSWLETQLKEVKKKRAKVITVTHQNVYAHNDLLVFGYQLYDGDKLKQLLEKYQVALNLSGHIHLQHYVEAKLSEITSSSLLMPPLQYGIINFTGSIDYSTQKINFANFCAKEDITDERIINLNDYSKQYFIEQSYKKGLSAMQQYDCQQQLKETVAEVFADYNYYYFSGEAFDASDYQQQAELAAGLGGFMEKYIEIITAEASIDFTKLKIEP